MNNIANSIWELLFDYYDFLPRKFKLYIIGRISSINVIPSETQYYD